MKRENLGKISRDLAMKQPDTLNPVEIEQEMHTDYDENIHLCIESSKKNYPGDFYIVVITKRERLMPNVFRNYFTARMSCPTPDYDQTVYHYRRSDDHIEFIWCIPCRESCFYLKENALLVDPEERQLLKFVLDFADGTLFKKAKLLNGEKDDSSLLVDENRRIDNVALLT